MSSWSSVLGNAQKSRDLLFEGDSLTALGSSNWPAFISANYPKSASHNSAAGGINSNAVLAQLQSDVAGTPQYGSRMTFIWTGVHDYTITNGVVLCLANVAAMVALLKPGWFRILEPLPVSTSTYYTGQPLRIIRDSLASQLAALYPSQYVTLLSALQAGGTGTGQDATDVANGIVPTSLRQVSDTIHMTLMASVGDGTGNGIIQAQVAASLAGF